MLRKKLAGSRFYNQGSQYSMFKNYPSGQFSNRVKILRHPPPQALFPRSENPGSATSISDGNVEGLAIMKTPCHIGVKASSPARGDFSLFSRRTSNKKLSKLNVYFNQRTRADVVRYDSFISVRDREQWRGRGPSVVKFLMS